MRRWKTTGEHLNGAYLRIPDVIVVNQGGLEGMVTILKSILAAGDPAIALVRIDIEE